MGYFFLVRIVEQEGWLKNVRSPRPEKLRVIFFFFCLDWPASA